MRQLQIEKRMQHSDPGKLFIGGISWSTNEGSLVEYFKNYGEVEEVAIMKDRNTGRARGFGFIVFSDPAVAERVVMEKHMIDGRMVEAKKAVPKDDQQILSRYTTSAHGSPGPGRTKKIFVGGLPSTIAESEFKKYFDQFGTITDVVVMYDHNTQRSRGFGFIAYDSVNAVDKVLFKTFHELNGKTVEVKRAVPKELSTGPKMRSPIQGYNYGLNRTNNFANGFTQRYNPSLFGGYGMRMDSRLGLPSSARNGFPSCNLNFGMGMNLEPDMMSSVGGNSSFGNNMGYGHGLGPYYSGNSTRFNSPIIYNGGNVNTSFVFSSIPRNAWDSGSLTYTLDSARSNACMPLGNGYLSGLSNNNLINWGGTAPISSQVGGNMSSYADGNLSHRGTNNNFDLGGGGIGRNNISNALKISHTASSGGFEETYPELYDENSLYGDPTWRSSSSDLEGVSSFEHALDNVPSDIIAKGSGGYMGNYNITNRQPNRGIDMLRFKTINRRTTM
ncbi:heterogeneous nuclear ribonucleoprotein 1-like isoform X1 [Zingiber officinale]|nr:heterogeneous nuclear ribonucleoprotein 1-like isoform X1 [Zingiber officinale]